MQEELLGALREALGERNVLSGGDVSDKYSHDWSAEPAHRPWAVVRPAGTEEVAAVLRLCTAHNQPVVVQGGLTGLCGGGIPAGGEIALSLERLAGVEEVDADAMTMTVKAGMPLEAVQAAAEEAGFLFPLDLGARGSCNIGGNIATNAGGNQVLRFGMTRNLVLGLEAVLADGTVVSSMNKMLKNNAGFDLKHLFIGTEGTLGIVTRAVLRLFPKPRSRCSALLALNSLPDVVALLRRVTGEFAGMLSAYEVMWDSYYQFIVDNVEQAKSPFDGRFPLYVLTEMEGSDEARDREKFEDTLGGAMEDGLVQDAVIANSERERGEFWRIRDGVGDIGWFVRDSANFDVSIPISSMEAFLDRIDAELNNRFSTLQKLVFGHIADSNLHIICVTGNREDVKTIYEMVYRAVGDHHGSISAEHGIGVQKLDYLPYSRGKAEIALMRALKESLDPRGILNPGRVIPPADSQG